MAMTNLHKQHRRRKTKTLRILLTLGLLLAFYLVFAVLGSLIGSAFGNQKIHVAGDVSLHHSRQKRFTHILGAFKEQKLEQVSERALLPWLIDQSDSDVDVELNCTPRSIEQFPNGDWSLTYEQRKNGAVVVNIIIVLYIFGSLAIVCDDYFVASLEYISDVLKLQPDVAGATFMAAGSSAPELFTSIIGVFFAHSDVGVGTIVGSAVFNILFIIGLCALGAGMVVHLTWWPLFRDCTYYTLTVIVLILVIRDEEIHWWEATILLVMYVIYVVFMYFNPKVGNYFITKVANWQKNSDRQQEYDLTSITSVDGEVQIKTLTAIEPSHPEHFRHHTHEDHHHHHQTVIVATIEGHQKELNGNAYNPDFVTQVDGHQKKQNGNAYSPDFKPQEQEPKPEEDEHEEYESPWLFPDTWPKRIFWVIMLPATFIFFITIPDCRREGCWKKWFPITFINSIIWIASLSYVMVWMVTVIGDTFGIPDTVMGLTLLAAGTSIPDAMASLFVARDGFGDMAVSNSIGSNIFDILIGLGLPWIIQTAIIDPDGTVTINSGALIFSAISLLVTVLFLLVTVFISKWRLNKPVGIVCLSVYVIFLVFACLTELNVFGEVNLPSCPRSA